MLQHPSDVIIIRDHYNLKMRGLLRLIAASAGLSLATGQALGLLPQCVTNCIGETSDTACDINEYVNMAYAEDITDFAAARFVSVRLRASNTSKPSSVA